MLSFWAKGSVEGWGGGLEAKGRVSLGWRRWCFGGCMRERLNIFATGICLDKEIISESFQYSELVVVASYKTAAEVQTTFLPTPSAPELLPAVQLVASAEKGRSLINSSSRMAQHAIARRECVP